MEVLNTSDITLQDIIEQIRQTTGKKIVTRCGNCNKICSKDNPFCDEKCEQDYYDYINIQIPEKFIRRLKLYCDDNQRNQEIKDFALRHDYNLTYVHKKIGAIYTN